MQSFTQLVPQLATHELRASWRLRGRLVRQEPLSLKLEMQNTPSCSRRKMLNREYLTHRHSRQGDSSGTNKKMHFIAPDALVIVKAIATITSTRRDPSASVALDVSLAEAGTSCARTRTQGLLRTKPPPFQDGHSAWAHLAGSKNISAAWRWHFVQSAQRQARVPSRIHGMRLHWDIALPAGPTATDALTLRSMARKSVSQN